MQITEKPEKACVTSELGRLLAELELNRCVKIEPHELPWVTQRQKIRVLGMRVSRIRALVLPRHMHRQYFIGGYYFVERTA